MNNGWIKLHRRILDNPRAGDPEWVAIWTYLLLNATHQPFAANFDGKIVTLQPGQLITGRLSIAERTGVHESKVKRILSVMKTDQQIDQQAGVKGSIITVRNWQLYQDCDQQNGQRLTSDRPASDQRLTTNKNIRTGEQKKGESPPTDGFNKFWENYPRKVEKADALKAWHEHVGDKEAELLPKILAALGWQTKQSQWVDDKGSFIPYPATWIRKGRWEDQPDKARGPLTEADHAEGWKRRELAST